MDKFFYALTVIGKDKKGIVASVAKVLYEKGFSIEDSSSTLLKDQFSMILMLSNKNNIGIIELKKAFAHVRKDLSMSVSVRRIEHKEIDTLNNKKEENLFMVSVYGSDKPGIVYAISDALSKNNINIVDLRTRVTKAEKPVYVMILEIDAPANMRKEDIKKILDKASSSVGVDYSIREVETYEL